ncbi:MAG: hypothetical protein ACRCX2_10170 [Paraclostridium sp.]
MSKKAFIGQANGEKFYAKQVKKRKRILIEYEDGSVEECTSGILYTLEEIGDSYRLTGKHLNTKKYKDAYVHGLAHIVMGMLDNEEEMDRMFND